MVKKKVGGYGSWEQRKKIRPKEKTQGWKLTFQIKREEVREMEEESDATS